MLTAGLVATTLFYFGAKRNNASWLSPTEFKFSLSAKEIAIGICLAILFSSSIEIYNLINHKEMMDVTLGLAFGRL